MKQPQSRQVARLVHVLHHTRYDYQHPVAQSWQLAHVTPRTCPHQQVQQHGLTVAPFDAERREQVDYFGNPMTVIALNRPHQRLDILAESEVWVAPPEPDSDACLRPWEQAQEHGNGPQALEWAQYRMPSPRVPIWDQATRYARRSFSPGRPFAQAYDELAQRIYTDFTFDPHASGVMTPVENVFERRRGVCQDFAQLMVACLRGLGVPARYVSGYIVTQPPAGVARLIGADASHAWVSAWCPGHGWLDIDPTNNRRIDQDFVTLAWGRDFSDVTPVRGVVLGGGLHQLDVRVTVTPDPDDRV